MTLDAREPEALPERARAWLEDYVAVHAMPRDRFVRIGRAIRTARAPDDRRMWIVGGVLVAAAIAAVWASGLLGGEAHLADAKGAHGLVEDHAASRDEPHATRAPAAGSTIAAPIPAELPAVAPRDTASGEVASAPVRSPTVPRASPSGAVPSTTSTLAAERALLEGAWQALAAGDRARAIAIAERHRAEYRKGQLADVREAIDAIVRCADPGTDRASVLASFERAYPHAIALQQVVDACGATK